VESLSCFIVDVTRRHGDLIAARFPEARDAKQQPRLYAALDAETGREALGLALLAMPTWSEVPAFRFSLDVPTDCAERGVAAALLAHVVDTAREHHAALLCNARPPGSPAEHALLASFGFHEIRRTVVHRFRLQTARDVFRAEMARLQAGGRVRPGVECRPYAEGPAREISLLCRSEFGALTHGHLEALGEYAAKGKDVRFARSFWRDGRLVGAWGVGVADGVATFDPLLVARPWRNTFAFAHIVLTVLEALVDHGIEWGSAAVHADNLKVMAVMARVDAVAQDVQSLYELAFAAPGERA